MSPNFQARGTTAPTVALSMRQIAHIREEIKKSPLAASVFITPTTKQMVVRDLESLFQQLYHTDLPEPSIKDSGLISAIGSSAGNTNNPALALETQMAYHLMLAMHHTDVATWHKVVTKNITESAAAQDAAVEHSAKYDAVYDAAQLMGITVEEGNVGSIAIAFSTARADGKSDWCVSGISRYIEVTEALDAARAVTKNTAALNKTALPDVQPAPVVHSAQFMNKSAHDHGVNTAEKDQPTLF